MMRSIGYYVHQHGEGHLTRALTLADRNPGRFVLLGTGIAGRTGAIAAIDLADDRLATSDQFDGNDDEPERPHALHYAPLNHNGVRSRMTAIARWIAEARPALIVSDVSAEVAMLARLCSTPVAYVRLGGLRNDAAHLEAFRGASVLIAPFAEQLDDLAIPHWIRQKTVYAPGLVSHRAAATPRQNSVLVVCGRGGSSVTASDVIEATRSTPQHHWRVIGLTYDGKDVPPNLVFAGWVANPEIEIARAELVVGAAGDGLVGAVLAAQRPFICIPEPRPFGEQQQKANALQRTGAAITIERWPETVQWSKIFDAARTIDPKNQIALHDSDGAARLSRLLIEFADRQK